MPDSNYNDTKKCLICGSNHLKTAWLPATCFNNKTFGYFKCEKCSSLSIHPVPNDKDLRLIYGEDDHTYLKSMLPAEKIVHDFSWGAYNHRNIQIRFLKQILNSNKPQTMLDYATGSGFYMAYAAQHGIHATGIEFSQEFASLMANKTGLNIVSQKDFEVSSKNKKFDIIHFGHILEHLEKPQELLTWAKQYSHKNTLIVVDGPLEENFCFSHWLVKNISLLKGKRTVNYAPQHFTFTTNKSQLNFFESCGLKTMKFRVMEQDHPFPEKLKNIRQVPGYLISRFSILTSKLNPRWGNVFHYVGRFE